MTKSKIIQRGRRFSLAVTGNGSRFLFKDSYFDSIAGWPLARNGDKNRQTFSGFFFNSCYFLRFSVRLSEKSLIFSQNPKFPFRRSLEQKQTILISRKFSLFAARVTKRKIADKNKNFHRAGNEIRFSVK